MNPFVHYLFVSRSNSCRLRLSDHMFLVLLCSRSQEIQRQESPVVACLRRHVVDACDRMLLVLLAARSLRPEGSRKLKYPTALQLDISQKSTEFLAAKSEADRGFCLALRSHEERGAVGWQVEMKRQQQHITG